VFTRNQGGADNWGQLKILRASDLEANDRFGRSVSVSGDTLVVGADWAAGGPGNPAGKAGAAYVFKRNQGGADNWGQVKILVASDLQAGDFFGTSVSVSGDTLMVGAPGEDGGAGNPASLAGAAYVFARNQGGAENWGQVKSLHASDLQAGDNFGNSVSVSGDTLVVGAYLESGGAGDPVFYSGAAYVFARNQGGAENWGQVRILHDANPQNSGQFGVSVSISGDTLVVGTPNQGAAYVFARNQGGAENWGQVKILLASDQQASDNFGKSVSISGDTLVVGAPNEDGGAGDLAGNAGADNWGEVQILHASDLQANDAFGSAVSVSGDTLVVGAWQEAGGAGDPASVAGAAYTFGPVQGGWAERAPLHTSDQQLGDNFSRAVSVSGDTLVVGAPLEDGGAGNLAADAGAAYVFTRNQGGADNWGQVKILRASDQQAGDNFGISVSVSGDTLAVGAYKEDGGATNLPLDAGATYVFTRNQGGADNWGQVKILHASDLQASDYFGGSVSVSGDTLVVGAPLEDGGASNLPLDAGAAYVFTRNQGGAENWGQVQSLHASDLQASDQFGWSVSASGDTLGVGAPYEDGGAGDPASNAGAAYMFTRNQGGADNWGQVQSLHASDRQMNDSFGLAVSVSGDTLVVGAPFEDGGASNLPLDAGAAYVFTRNEGGAENWGQVQNLHASDPQTGDFFGRSVSASGDTLVVGASMEDGGAGDPASNAGAAYVFTRNQGGAENWGEVQSLHASDPQTSDSFGFAVCVSGNTLVVGAYSEDGGLGNPAADAGAAYVFTLEEEPLPSLSLSKSVNPASAGPGQTLTYTLVFSNTGSAAATGVILTDTIPVSVTATSVIASGVMITNTGAASPYVWQIADLVPGVTGYITVTGVLSQPLAAGTFTNTATLAAANASLAVNAQAVTVVLDSAKAITAFTVTGQTGSTAIDEIAGTIALTLPYGTNVTALVPAIVHTGASVNPADGAPQNFTSPVVYTVTAADSSTKAYTMTVTVALNPAKAITAFTVPGQTGSTAIDEIAGTIALTLPYGANVTALVPAIVHTGASVNPADGAPQNFTSPVVYTVTAADSSTKAYTATVTVALNPAKTITSFTVPGQAGGTAIDEIAGTIALTVPYGTDVTALVPAIVHTGASVNPANGAAQDFSSPVLYTVTAADSSTKAYTVTVTAELNAAKAITAFTVIGQTGSTAIDEIAGTIVLTIPHGTDVTALAPTVTHTGASVNPANGAPQDFSSPVVYTVTAADNSTKAYTVTLWTNYYLTYLPLVAYDPRPDLIVSFSLSPTAPAVGQLVTITVIVTNTGSAPANNFWIDFYINPSSPPTRANQVWNLRCSQTPCTGLAWNVTQALAPGQSVRLTSTAGSYAPAQTRWPGYFAGGTNDLYTYVDSYSDNGSPNGVWLEINESNNRAEQHGLNVAGLSVASAGEAENQAQPDTGLPPRTVPR
jgi:uncharacterized repeat protein (TIGR01451 family)